MVLVITLLAFSLALGLSVKKVGYGVYASLFVVSLIGSLLLLFLYRPSL